MHVVLGSDLKKSNDSKSANQVLYFPYTCHGLENPGDVSRRTRDCSSVCQTKFPREHSSFVLPYLWHEAKFTGVQIHATRRYGVRWSMARKNCHT
ncbi:Hypothetical predicted protein [Cloeon dipterum]|uniref:Uncharacterized protein n=1 Tax=Cloeon dipterum TaxID=197152 RepID=A0A8S1CXB5_9INSE|nr:Hypothetical predicted protein [Cloeon dipterum]